ncbi:MAG: type VI secretion system ATPase TssH, partial [Caldisericum exile]
MDQNKFTEKVQEALLEAKNIAVNYGNEAVDVEHVLVALINQKDGFVPMILESIGVPKNDILKELYSRIERFPKSHVTQESQFYITNRLNSLFVRAESEAKALQDEFISTEHLFLASLTDYELGQVYAKYGINRQNVLNAIQSIRGGKKVEDRTPEEKVKVLEKYGRDLVKLAKEGKLDPVIGRDEEIRRTIQILSRRTKNNPILIGE